MRLANICPSKSSSSLNLPLVRNRDPLKVSDEKLVSYGSYESCVSWAKLYVKLSVLDSVIGIPKSTESGSSGTHRIYLISHVG